MSPEEALGVHLVGANSWYWTGKEAARALFGFGCSKEDAERKLPKPEPTAEREAESRRGISSSRQQQQAAAAGGCLGGVAPS